MKLLVGLGVGLLVDSVLGACPNACSGHGQCGEHDMCICHVDWLGGDCSQRSCPSYFSWVTTNANGDLNADGDVNDVTVYDMDHAFTDMGIPYIISQNEPFGTWESWPAYGNIASKDEGHYYMECANRGICDRNSGQCECFPGFTGHACQRTTCPNECSGHGTCKTVAQQKGANAYDLWDKDMSRSCVCDSGFTGPDCNERKCPLGDDPLTTGQTYETQWVDIYTDIDTTNWNDRTFAGHISLKYTDYNGKVWQTDDIAVQPYATTLATTGATAINVNVQNALNGLPNNVLSGVTVTMGYMEKVIPGNVQIDGDNDQMAAATNGATSFVLDSGTKLLRCPAVTADKDKVMYMTSATAQVNYDNNAHTLAAGATDDTTCYEVDHFWSLRLQIKFPSTPGDLTNLQVDTSKVTVGGLTDAQRGSGNELIGSAVSGSRLLGVQHATGGMTAVYTQTSSVTTTCTGTGGNGCGIATKVVTVTDATERDKYPANSRVEVTCNGVLRGVYTVASVHASNAELTLSEDIADCTLGAAENLGLVLKSNIVEVNGDLTGLLAAGDLLLVSSFKSVTPKISSVQWSDSLGKGHIFLDTDFGATETISNAGTATVKQQGDGTTEKEECSARGLCDSETGICRCFHGYTGWSCSVQNSLAVPL